MQHRSPGRGGHRWRLAREWVLRHYTTCWICGERVDRELQWPDPMSASVDHFIPLEHGGAARERSNLWLAHLTHNIARRHSENREAKARAKAGKQPDGSSPGLGIRSRDW